MSCAFRALPRLIPNILLCSPKGTEVIIVSPWIQQVDLKPPILKTKDYCDTREQMPLSEFLLFLITERNLSLIFVVRENDYRIRNVTRNILQKHPGKLQIIESKYLHAKAIVTPKFVLQTSANLIPTSLYRNTETCSIFLNKYGSASRYVEYELKLYV
jgi:phosphatidylserine/phosphatidylglycerophosphate/cardiolipin synthase-like enzyme